LSPLIGQALGHYRILRQLGAGGMGEVYEAEDTRLGRKVALKVLPEDMARDPQKRERFECEAKAVAALNHPNIVTIYSVEQADGVHFITMELVEGQTLRQVLPRGGMSLGSLLDVAVPLAEAVAAAHRQGITHRDLKPENILVSRDGKTKVLDFGLAKLGGLVGEAGDISRLPTRALTDEGRIVGTIAYMSPEQAEGKPVDPRSDVFTLGIILYEMSTGERPFKGSSVVSILSSILKDAPPLVTQINTSLPHDLARIVDRCLMKDPARRFHTAMGLATEMATLKKNSDSEDLEAVTAGGRRTRAAGSPARAASVRGRKIVYTAAALVAGFAVAGYLALRAGRGGPVASGEAPGGATLRDEGLDGAGSRSVDDRQRIVILPFENLGAPDDAYFAAGMTEEITSRLASVGGLGVISRNSAVLYAKTGKTTKQLGQELGVDYVLGGTVRWERGGPGPNRVRVTPQLVRVADDTQLWGDRYDSEMKHIFEVQSEIAEQVVEKLGVAMRQPERQAIGSQPTHDLDAYQAYLRGKEQLDSFRTDRETEEKAVQMLGRAVQLDPKFAVAWASLSRAHSSMYNSRDDFTEDRLVKARQCADEALSLHPDLPAGHVALGYYYYWGRRDYEQALREFEIAAGGRDNDSEILEAVAYIRRRQGHWDEAIAAMVKAFALNPRNSNLPAQISGAYENLRRYPEAMRYVESAISLAPEVAELKVNKAFLQFESEGNTRAARATLKQINPRDFPGVRWAETYLDSLDGRYKEALDVLAGAPGEVLETQDVYFPKPLIAGFLHLALEDTIGARRSCESARLILEQENARNPRDPRIRSALGMALACVGRKEEAVRQARLAADISPVSSDAVSGPASLLSLAQVYAMSGDSDAALDLLDRLLIMPGGAAISFIKHDPIWAPLRTLPRYRELMKKYG
jgi:eukaryotic-like serine/threonine-protein kinase